MSEVPSARYGTRIDATTWHGHLAASGLLGTDPESRRQRWLAKTVHGSKRFANKQLEELLEEAGRGRLRAGRVSDLLERWFGVASPGWAVSTASHTRSVIDCYLRPYFGHLRVGKITTEDIDDFYGYLLRWGGNRGQPLAPGTVARVHGVGLRSGRSVGVGFREPCFGRHAPRVQPAEIRPPNPTQVGVLLGWARQRKPSLFCYLRLVACTGARRSRRQPFAKQRVAQSARRRCPRRPPVPPRAANLALQWRPALEIGGSWALRSRRTIPAMDAPDPVARGWMALLAGAWQEARAAFEEALKHGETPEALDGLAGAAGWLDDAATALSARERAYRLFLQRGDRELAARVAFNMALDVLNFRGDPAVASGWIQRGRDLLRDRPESPWLGAIDLAEAWMAVLFDKDIPKAQRLAERALEAGYRTGVPDMVIIAKSRLGEVLVSAGQVADGMRLLDEASAAALAGEMFDAASSVAVCCSLMTACLRVRDLDRAAQWHRQASELADRRLAEPFRSWRWEYGTVLVWWGRWEEAERELVQEMEGAAARPVQAGMAQVALADLRRRQGRFHEADEVLDDLDARSLRFGLAHLTLSTRAALSLDRGDHQTAIDLAESYLRAVPRDDPVERVDALEILARARAALGDPEGAEVPAAELHDIAEGVETPALRAAARFATGEVAAARGDAAGARDAFERARDLFDQAGAPFEAARARLRLAWALVGLGRADGATAEARAAQLAFDALGARADTKRATKLLVEIGPDITERPDHRLSAREVDVLRLVGQGRSNEEIASELFLSVRTVERHLSNVYSKIGAHGRAARVLASTYATDHGLM